MILSYTTKFQNDLSNVYSKYLLSSTYHETAMGMQNLIEYSLNDIQKIQKEYDFILFMRIDLYLKDKFTQLFDSKWDKILFPSICFKPHHIILGHPRVNDVMTFFPKKYFNYINCTKFCHDAWYFFMNETDLTYDDIDTMIETFNDSDSAKDFNPMYFIVNRPECQRFHTEGEIFNKYLL